MKHSSMLIFTIIILLNIAVSCNFLPANQPLEKRIVAELHVEEIVHLHFGDTDNADFLAIMQRAVEYKQSENSLFLECFERAFLEMNASGDLALSHFVKDSAGKIDSRKTDDEVLQFLQAELDTAIEHTVKVFQARLQNFGIKNFQVQHLEDSDKILLDLPNIENMERLQALLFQKGEFEFRETFASHELFSSLMEINDFFINNPDFIIEFFPVMGEIEAYINNQGAQSDEEIVRLLENKRFENFPILHLLEMNIVFDPATGEQSFSDDPSIGTVAVKDTAIVASIFAQEQIRGFFPRNLQLLWSFSAVMHADDRYSLVATKKPSVVDVQINNDYIVDARQAIGYGNNPEIMIVMNNEGSLLWQNLTRKNIGKSVAIILDGQVYAYPMVQTEIQGGRSSITGNFTIEEAQDIATILRSDALPVKMILVED